MPSDDWPRQQWARMTRLLLGVKAPRRRGGMRHAKRSCQSSILRSALACAERECGLVGNLNPHGTQCDWEDIACNEDDDSLAASIAQAPIQYMMETEEHVPLQDVVLRSVAPHSQLRFPESKLLHATVSTPDTLNNLYRRPFQNVALYSADTNIPFENFNWRGALTQQMVHRLKRSGSLRHRCAYIDLQRSYHSCFPIEVKFHVIFGRERSGPATYSNAKTMELRRVMKNFLRATNKSEFGAETKANMQRHIQYALNVVEGKHGATYSSDIGRHFDIEDIHIDFQAELSSQ